MHYTSPEVYEYISRQTNDAIVERKTCRISGKQFAIFQSDLDFYDKISPVFNGKQYKIPTPTLCPEERQRRRLLFRNERKLYRRKCDATGESIISIYSPDKQYKIYKQDFWWGDGWDSMQYGREFEPEKTLTQQFQTQAKENPYRSLISFNGENSEYTNQTMENKNCYFVFSGLENSSCFFGRNVRRCDLCVDSNQIVDCHSSANIIIGKSNYNVFFGVHVFNCRDSKFLWYCDGCSNCFCCSNLKNKQYHIFNKSYTKEEYYKKISYFETGNYETVESIQRKRKKICKASPSIARNLLDNEGFVSCDTVRNSKNVQFSRKVTDSTDIKYGSEIEGNTDCYDLDVSGENCFLVLDSIAIGKNTQESIIVINSHNIERSMYMSHCFYCTDCFGCVGLRNKSYCIFNKQYSKEEYEALVPQIIEQMIQAGERGEFFDPSLSPFGYNETIAQDYFPLTRDEALARGYKRQDNNYDPKIPEGTQTLKGSQIPTDITTVTDDILKKIFICEVSERPFRIIKQELEFYRKHNLPLPRKHPDVRHEERLKQRPPRELHLRNCDKCSKEMLSVYGRDSLVGHPNSPVYCEDCYAKEMFS